MTNEIIRETQLHMSTQHLCVWDNGIYMYIYDWNIEKFENNEFMPLKNKGFAFILQKQKMFCHFLVHCFELKLQNVTKCILNYIGSCIS